jgi:hypothetical protein
MSKSPVPGEPFDSFELMRKAHQTLFDLLPENEVSPSDQALVAEFLRRGTATGAILENYSDRRQAQVLLDYWRSCDTLAESVLVPFEPQRVIDNVQRIQNWFESQSSPVQTLVRHLLLALIRLKEDDDFAPARVPHSTLLSMPESSELIVRTLDDLERLRVVRYSQDPSGEKYVTLASPELLKAWEPLRLLTSQRQEFRRASQEWEHNRQNTLPGFGLRALREVKQFLALLGRGFEAIWKWPLRQLGLSSGNPPPVDTLFPDAEYYRDRTSTELNYLYQQRLVSVERSERNRIMLSFAVLLLIVMSFLSIYLASKLSDAAVKEKINNHEFELRETREKRQRLKLLVAMVRNLAEIRALPTDRALIARWRFEQLESHLRSDAQLDLQNDMKEIGMDFSPTDSLQKKSSNSLEIAAKLRLMILERAKTDPDTHRYFQELRRTNYRMVERLVKEIVEIYSGQDSVEKLRACVEEFLILYWGEMVVVESLEVAEAMVEFRTILTKIDNKRFSNIPVVNAQNNDPEATSWKKIESLKDAPLLKGLSLWTLASSAGSIEKSDLEQLKEQAMNLLSLVQTPREDGLPPVLQRGN